MAAHSPFHRLWCSKYCVQRDCCLKNHVYRFSMNGTITSNHSASTHYHFIWHYFGMSLIYMEGDWGELGHGPTYPHALLANSPQDAVTILEITWHIYYDPRQAAIVSLIEVKTSTYLSGEGTSDCSNDPWSYDEIFTDKSFLVPENLSLKTGPWSEHDESQWTSRQCLCTSIIAIWLTSSWK